MQNYDPDQRRILSALCHGACFFSATLISVGIPIAILFFTDDSVTKANAKEALNFQITIFILGFASILLSFILIGFLLLFPLIIFSIIAPIIGIIKVLEDPSQPYRYPLIFRLV
ncbi:DUF4870 domain-containing protein [Merismopedia glauca]|uniref:DUF4870 domain-containing protein n=1 Tax=Merismopedia glauca CCAP 1448/3 TaxID=1296344 RepID=A0A2T1BZW1_9CYAN|nr:DUF4870 domain-containing protein [Merismopedia glauca CCAP 1448/3]